MKRALVAFILQITVAVTISKGQSALGTVLGTIKRYRCA